MESELVGKFLSNCAAVHSWKVEGIFLKTRQHLPALPASADFIHTPEKE